jgi:hypothetical protein
MEIMHRNSSLYCITPYQFLVPASLAVQGQCSMLSNLYYAVPHNVLNSLVMIFIQVVFIVH